MLEYSTYQDYSEGAEWGLTSPRQQDYYRYVDQGDHFVPPERTSVVEMGGLSFASGGGGGGESGFLGPSSHPQFVVDGVGGGSGISMNPPSSLLTTGGGGGHGSSYWPSEIVLEDGMVNGIDLLSPRSSAFDVGYGAEGMGGSGFPRELERSLAESAHAAYALGHQQAPNISSFKHSVVNPSYEILPESQKTPRISYNYVDSQPPIFVDSLSPNDPIELHGGGMGEHSLAPNHQRYPQPSPRNLDPIYVLEDPAPVTILRSPSAGISYSGDHLREDYPRPSEGSNRALRWEAEGSSSGKGSASIHSRKSHRHHTSERSRGDTGASWAPEPRQKHGKGHGLGEELLMVGEELILQSGSQSGLRSRSSPVLISQGQGPMARMTDPTHTSRAHHTSSHSAARRRTEGDQLAPSSDSRERRGSYSGSSVSTSHGVRRHKERDYHTDGESAAYRRVKTATRNRDPPREELNPSLPVNAPETTTKVTRSTYYTRASPVSEQTGQMVRTARSSDGHVRGQRELRSGSLDGLADEGSTGADQRSSQASKQFLEQPLRPGTNLIQAGKYSDLSVSRTGSTNSHGGGSGTPVPSPPPIRAHNRPGGLPDAPMPPCPFIVPSTHLPSKGATPPVRQSGGGKK